MKGEAPAINISPGIHRKLKVLFQTLGYRISEHRNHFKQDTLQGAQSSALDKGSPRAQDMEGQVPVVSISLEIDQKLKMQIYRKICVWCNVAPRAIFRNNHAESSRQYSSFARNFYGVGNSATSNFEQDSRISQLNLCHLRHESELFEATKLMYLEEYGFSSNDNQGEPVGNLIKGSSRGQKNHLALSGEQYNDVSGVTGSGLNGTIDPENRCIERNTVC